MGRDTSPSGDERSPRLTKRQELLLAASFFAVVFGCLVGHELSSRGQLTPMTLVVLLVLSLIGGVLFAIGFWCLYLRKHRL
jgi:hypothetical protein